MATGGLRATTDPTPRVTVFGLGGTIAMTPGSAGAVPALTVEQLLAAVPGLTRLDVELATVNLRNVPSSALTVADLEELATAIRQRCAGGTTGVVVTQGTDTIEETAYLLDLRHDGPEPVVVTGAMRTPGTAGADGPANLIAAIRVATSPAARDLGCLVAMADEVHAARRVRKSHTTSPGSFSSPDGGPVGFLVEGAVRIVNRPDGRFRVPVPAVARPARVGVQVMTFGDDGTDLAAATSRLDGLVVAGFGVGHVPAGCVAPLAALAARMPVVLASRADAGPVLSGTYGYPGSETDLIGRGLIPAGLLDPYKSRILLQLLISAGAGRARIAAAFGAAGGLGDRSGWPWPPPGGGPRISA